MGHTVNKLVYQKYKTYSNKRKNLVFNHGELVPSLFNICKITLSLSSIQSSASASSPALPPEKPQCTGSLVGITVPWSGWLKLGTEQRAARHGAQNPCRPRVHPTAAGPSLSACSAESCERLILQAQTGRAQAGYQRGMQADTRIKDS